MEKKTTIQIVIILILILISVLIYKFYYNQDLQNEIKVKEKSILNDKIDTAGQNLIMDIKYTSNNNRGDMYEIIADYGEISLVDPDLMFLTNVTGNIIFKEKKK